MLGLGGSYAPLFISCVLRNVEPNEMQLIFDVLQLRLAFAKFKKEETFENTVLRNVKYWPVQSHAVQFGYEDFKHLSV